MTRPLLSALCCAALATTAHATDGVIEINHARALAGGITPGDAPGYPVTISQSGSYRLTSELVVPANTVGIELNPAGSHSDPHYNMDLDLNGFGVRGPGTCTYATVNGEQRVSSCTTDNGFGIANNVIATQTYWNLSIHDGYVHGMGNDGISVDFARIRNVSVSQNGGNGVSKCNELIDSVVMQNGLNGVMDCRLVSRSVISNNSATGVGNSGTVVNAATAATLISHSVVSNNGGSGVFAYGLSLDSSSVLNNGDYGVVVPANSVALMRGNLLTSNALGSYQLLSGAQALSSGSTNICGTAANPTSC